MELTEHWRELVDQVNSQAVKKHYESEYHIFDGLLKALDGERQVQGR